MSVYRTIGPLVIYVNVFHAVNLSTSLMYEEFYQMLVRCTQGVLLFVVISLSFSLTNNRLYSVSGDITEASFVVFVIN